MEKDKKLFTDAEKNELIHWFDGKALPKEMQIHSGLFTRNTADTVQKIIYMIRTSPDNANLIANMRMLGKIRQRLIDGDSSQKDSGENNTNEKEA